MGNDEVYNYDIDDKRQEKRQKIAKALKEKKTYRQIQEEIGVSTSTISNIKKMMMEKGEI